MYQAIVFLPLAGFLIAGLFGKRIGPRPSEIVTTALVGLAALLSWVAFVQVGFGSGTTRVQIAPWIVSGELVVDWALRIDTLTAVMLVVVNTVSALVHLYSIGYMHEDPARARFFAYLSLFTFTMLALVTADNLVQMFFGWEGVGLASYLLIGFWTYKPSANAAAMKAFIVNRVGDFGFALGIFLVFVLFNSVAFDSIFPRVGELKGATFAFLGFEWHALTLACLLLLMGAMGKSAQLGLHTWLPDAMEGPTPVSALIHAATMVTAGVFMVARLSPLFEAAPAAQTAVIVVGALTAFFAATVGLVQNDIKRVIAYSTCSQLGYMFVALGLGAYSVAIFHLFTHAFFKALLFLGAGSVIHAMHHEQDLRRMGGLLPFIPWTAAAMLIGTLALIGFPLTAGFYSKDAVIEAAFASQRPGAILAFLTTVIAAVLTSFYSFRLLFMAFIGPRRWEHGAAGAHGDDASLEHDAVDHGHAGHPLKPHESPLVMLVPLGALSLGALVAGMAFEEQFTGHEVGHFFKASIVQDSAVLDAMHHVPGWVAASPILAMLLGFVFAFWFYVWDPKKPAQLAANQPLLYNFLLNKWYFDELYGFLFVRPAKWLGRFFWHGGDERIIDGLGPNGISARVMDATGYVVRIQTGFVYHYAFAMLLGVAALVSWTLFRGGQ